MNRLPTLIFLLWPFLAVAESTFDCPDNIASTEGLPNNLVNGCFCAISGEFVQSINEFVIPGPEPLVHTANYGSRFNWGLSWVNFETIHPFTGYYEGRTTSIYGLRQPSGAHIFYYSTEEADKIFKKTGRLEKNMILQVMSSKNSTRKTVS